MSSDCFDCPRCSTGSCTYDTILRSGWRGVRPALLVMCCSSVGRMLLLFSFIIVVVAGVDLAQVWWAYQAAVYMPENDENFTRKR